MKKEFNKHKYAKPSQILLALFILFCAISIVFLPISKLPENSYRSSQENSININFPIISSDNKDKLYPEICSDGEGGAIIVWHDNRGIGTTGIYAQRVNSSGEVYWTLDGVAISTEDDFEEHFPQICSDGNGGAIIAWDDTRNGIDLDIYAQRINSNGDVVWTSGGVAICTAIDDQIEIEICSDGTGGAIITWDDRRSVSTDWDIYAQRINSTGDIQWTPNGEVICSSIYEQYFPQICSDGVEGAIITWHDARNILDGRDIYAQRINSTGDTKWTKNGIAISTSSFFQNNPQICVDGEGGAIITWDGNSIYAQRVNSTGGFNWTASGETICTPQGGTTKICSDEAGGAIITWDDRRYASSPDIFAQRVDPDGNILWTSSGEEICTADNIQFVDDICNDGDEGAIIVWGDSRNDPESDIYTQRVDKTGNIKWTSDGESICAVIDMQSHARMCKDDEGGAIITWSDERNGSNLNIYAQRVDSNGNMNWTTNGIPISIYRTYSPSSSSSDGGGGGGDSSSQSTISGPSTFLVLIVSVVAVIIIIRKYKKNYF